MTRLMTDAERLERFRANAIHELKRGLLCIEDGIRDLRRPELNHDIRAELQGMNPAVVMVLLENMPKIAKPWVVLDMSSGEVTKWARHMHGSVDTRNYEDQVAIVHRAGVWTTWAAYAGGMYLPPTDDSWTLEEAKAACDARLRELGVVLL
jgi:hypothetical protein